MPYQAGNRLPGECASRIGHLEVIKNPLVRSICKNFRDPVISDEDRSIPWEGIPDGGKPLRYIFGVDGSLQVIHGDVSPYSTIAFVKTAMLKLDQHELEKVDPETPHPYVLRDILQDAAIYHATVFPLENVEIPGRSNYDTIRDIIFQSIGDKTEDMEGEVLETLKWIAYKKWSGNEFSTTEFECPHCHDNRATLPHNDETGFCPKCGKPLYLTDWLGFHQEMVDDSAPEQIASTYMNVHETLLLFTAIRYYWENKRKMLPECLFVKDGPLSVRAQYSKLVQPIRQFLSFARDEGCPVHIIGQEKSGRFFDHFQFIQKDAPSKSLFIPGDLYIKRRIQHRPDKGAEYGHDTNYGAKLFVKLNEYHPMVLNIPFGEFDPNPQLDDLIGAPDIFSTIPKILSNRHEGALLPIELAHGIASLSTYPSAKMLKLFTDATKDTT